MNKKTEEDLIAEVQRLRMENEYLKKLNALVQAREKSARKIKIIVTELRHKYKLADLLKVAGIPRSTYYYYLKNMKRPDKYEHLKSVITQSYHDNKGRYGSQSLLSTSSHVGPK